MSKMTTREEVAYVRNGDEVYERETTAVPDREYEYVTGEYDRELSPRQKMRKTDQALWLLLSIVEILIGMRVFLKLIAANPQSGFASFVYTLSAPLLAPFNGLTQTPSANGAVLEIPSLIAMVVYALLFWLATYTVRLIWERP